jgi:hypothetical protein
VVTILGDFDQYYAKNWRFNENQWLFSLQLLNFEPKNFSGENVFRTITYIDPGFDLHINEFFNLSPPPPCQKSLVYLNIDRYRYTLVKA